MGVFVAASEAVLKICLVVLSGALATRRLGLARTTISDLGRLTINVLLPALTASSLARSITPEALAESWVAAAFAALHVATGLFGGLLVVALLRVLRRPPETTLAPELCCCCAFGNTSALPIALLPAVASGEQVARGLLFVNVYCVVWRLLMYTLAPVILTHHGPWGSDDGRRRDDATAKQKPRRSLRSAVSGAVLSPPNLGSAVGLAVALLPPVKALLGPGGALSCLADSVAFVGKAADVMLMVMLGGSLAHAMDSSGGSGGSLGARLDPAAALVGCAARLLLIPSANVALGALALRAGWLPGQDPALVFVVLLCGVVPSAMQLGAIVGATGRDTVGVTLLMLWQHLAAPLTLTGFIAWSLHLAQL